MAEAARRVEAAGADIVDINFGCPVRKVTKTGAGASLLDEPAHAARIVAAVAAAVAAGFGEDAARHRRRLPRLPDRRAARSSRPAPRRSRSIPARRARCTPARADHSLTAELVSLVEVPVIASGDVTSAARAQAVLAETGAAAVMVGRAAQGNPWAISGDPRPAVEPIREEVVAELLLFMRETVRELGERRASGFLKKFYAWYLGRGRFPKPFKQEIVVLESTLEVERRLLAAAPGAAAILERLEAEASRSTTSCCSTRFRSRSTAAAERRGHAPFQWFRSHTSRSPCSVSSGSIAVIVREWGAISSASPPVATTGAPGASSSSRMRSTIASTCPAKPYTSPDWRRGDGRLADDALGRAERHPWQPSRTREEGVHRDLDSRCEHTAGELPGRRDDVEVRGGAEVDDDRGGAVALARRDGVRDPVGPTSRGSS